MEGPQGSGTTEAALHLAMSLNCLREGGTEWACGECSSCMKVRNGVHPDIHNVFPRRKKLAPEMIQQMTSRISKDPYNPYYSATSDSIVVDDIRALRDTLYLRAFEGRYKVGILLDADSMNPSSGNALLRILEEPPENCILILTTAKASRILPTILSRCILLKFPRFPDDFVRSYLIDEGLLTEEKAGEAAILAEGSLTRAREFCDERYGIIRETATNLLKLSLAKPGRGDYDLINGTARQMDNDDAYRTIEFLGFLIRCIHSPHKSETDGVTETRIVPITDDKTISDIRRRIGLLEPVGLLRIVKIFEECLEMLARNIQIPLVLFMLVHRMRRSL